jgi:hypothetical protein
MSGRPMNWSRARRWQDCESKYGANVVLSNGSITPPLPKDDLTRRSESAMRDWLRGLSRRDRETLGRAR